MSSGNPNILFVFADQMSAHHMGCAGNPDIITPVLDRMADEGVLCENHISNCPICSPNRASMLTGTYPTTHTLLFNDTQVRTDIPSLGTLAKAHGYRTGYIGKWHIDAAPREAFIPTGPRRLGFDDYWAVLNAHHEYFNTRYYFGDSDELIRREGYEPEIQTEMALDFLEEHGKGDTPFCLAVSFGPPHNSYELVPEKYQRMYDDREIAYRPNCAEIPEEHLDPAWAQPHTTRDFYALVTSLDEMMGRMLAKLEELGIADNTIVVFTADHGDMLWSQGLLYKCVPFTESAGIPLLVRYPGAIPAGTRLGDPIASVDLLPTLAGLAGWDMPDGLEGMDTSRLLRGEEAAEAPSEAFFGLYHTYEFRPDFPVPEWRGIRTERYTYTETTDRTPWLVFDNQNDPYQLTNLANAPEATDLRNDLGRRLDQRLTELGDPFLDTSGMQEHYQACTEWEFE
ncbi:MAG: sulfatase family protein [Planctomycetota bacterium]|jgi:arylsulfatase A-like enzyme